jgi:phosphoribosylformylglycinamidine synthase
MFSNGKPKVCVLKADGTNCEVETAHAFRMAGALAEILPMNRLRAGEARLADYDILVAPGGFSYGDDVVSGKIMAVEMMSFLADSLAEFVAAGKPVMGICNGFQVLVRTGLLPFGEAGDMRVTLGQNASGRFECRWADLARTSDAAIVAGLPRLLSLPVANGEGRFYADDATLARIEAEGLVALRYVDADGAPTQDYPANPNGSLSAIAGICDPSGRILGLMPHPERFLARHQHPDWRGLPEDMVPDGLAFFEQVVALA